MNADRSGRAFGPRAEPPVAATMPACRAAPGVASAAHRESPSAALSHREKRLIIMSVMLPVFIGSVDQSILASSLPTIGRSLGDVHELPWLITVFLISATALTPLYGKFADIHGRRAALLIALGVYMAGSLISAFSPSMAMLICGRLVQGCGAAGLTNTGIMILGDIAAPKDRGKYYGYFSVAFTTAGGCGPALGGWICDHLHWSVIFLWNLPLCVVAVLLTLTVLRRLPRREQPHRLDFIGAILVIAASSSFMLALNLGGVRFPWLSPPVVGLLAGSLILGIGLVVRLLTAAEPLIPIGILSDRSAQLTIAAHSFGWGSIIGLNIFLPMYLQSALGWSATASGLGLMILMVTMNASAGFSSQLLGRVSHYKLLPTIFLFISICAVLALAFSAGAVSSLQFEIILLLIGVGFGPTAPLTQVMLQNSVPSQHLGAAVGTMNFARSLAGTIAVAVYGAIVFSGVPVEAHAAGQHVVAGTAVFVSVFLVAAGALTVAFVSMLLAEAKPLQEGHPGSDA